MPTPDAIKRLTETHTVYHDGKPYECTALLHQLHAARRSSIGAGSGGGNGDCGLINMAAYTLWEHIDGATRAILTELGANTRGSLWYCLYLFPRIIQAAESAGKIDADTRDRYEALPAQWVYAIEDLFDPPHQYELTAPCPACGGRYKIDGDTQQAAVIIPVKRGRAVIAECRCCNTMWATEPELVALADGMGIEVDFVTLRELTLGHATPAITQASESLV